MIAVHEVTKVYGRKTVLDGLSFTCAPGRVTGFLGPNGAGKSTMLRILAGLTRATSGVALFDGRPYAELPRPASLVGMTLDASTLHPGRTGLETALVTARMVGASPARAAQLFQEVGLGGAEKKRVGNYSLGMRQRLGIAVALMGDPSVLVMDEPVNGLDPQGVFWIRSLVRDFARRGGTVLLSSHLLHEVQATVDDLIIIDHGRLVAQWSIDEIMRAGGTVVSSPQQERFIEALQRREVPYKIAADRILIDESPLAVGTIIAEDGIVVTELGPGRAGDLESLFLQLTRSADQPATAPGGGR